MKEKKLKIAYDLDGTLFSINKAIEMFNKHLNEDKKLEDFKDYSFKKVYDIDDVIEASIWEAYNEEIIKESKPLKCMLAHAKKMKSLGAEVIIITARGEKYYKENKQSLDYHKIPYDRIYMNQLEKYAILKEEKVDRFFDDRGELIESLMSTDIAKTCELTLIDAPYNKGFNCHSRMYIK